MNKEQQTKALELLGGVLKLRNLIEYPKDTSEEHYGEAQAVSTMLSEIGDFLNTVNFNVLHYASEQLAKNLNNKLESLLIEGLERKGFKFNGDKREIGMFVATRCHCADDKYKKERTYYVDKIPFFFHRYEQKWEPMKVFDALENKFEISGNLGSYAFL